MCRDDPLWASGNWQVFVSEHFGQRDQGQANQGSGVGRLDAFEQRDAKTLRLRTAGAIVGWLRPNVALDFGLAYFPESDFRGHDLRLRPAIGGIEQRNGGYEAYCLAAGMPELGEGPGVISGLVEPNPLTECDLVRADDTPTREQGIHALAVA